VKQVFRVPDIELIFRGSSLKPHIWFPGIRRPFKDAFAVRPVLLRPKSRGEVLLRSANPFDPPRIRLDFLSDPDDLGRLVRAARISFELIESAPFDAFRGRPLEPVSRSTDQDIADWIRRTAGTINHACATAAIGMVLDPEMRVRGIQGLRVVDASAMPSIVGAHIGSDPRHPGAASCIRVRTRYRRIGR
jgi:4-pyridoxate dehydrogenase